MAIEKTINNNPVGVPLSYWRIEALIPIKNQEGKDLTLVELGGYYNQEARDNKARNIHRQTFTLPVSVDIGRAGIYAELMALPEFENSEII